MSIPTRAPLGYLPSTLIQAASPSGAEPVAEPSRGVVLLLAVLLGLVGGAVLSFFQARVPRQHAAGSRRWIPANMLAWTLGMPLIILGLDLAFASTGTTWSSRVVCWQRSTSRGKRGGWSGSRMEHRPERPV